jgi:carboxyl-terminal processing protease
MIKSTPFRRLFVVLGLALLTAIGGSGQPRMALANTAIAVPDEQHAGLQQLHPTDRHRSIARRVYENLDRSHYAQAPLDDRMSSRMFDLYVEAMDPSRLYFTAADIAEFERLRLRFDDAIKTGALEPAFDIFRRFQVRNHERLQYAIGLLEQEPDYTLDESFAFDRSEAPWAATREELDELWRQRVKNDGLGQLLAGKEDWAQTAETLRKRYARLLKSSGQINADDVFQTFMNAYARAYDPHSNYFSPQDSEEYRIQMSLNYEGIGASLQLEDDYVTVQNVIEGGPAHKEGSLKVNDRITGVGQGDDGPITDVVGWRLDDVVQLIRGPGGSVVRLQILPGTAAPGDLERVVAYTRNKVDLELRAAQKELSRIQRDGRELSIGIITVPSFYQDYAARAAGDRNFRSTTRDVRKLIEELQQSGIDGLVIDLRGNGGGSLPEATGLTGLFVDGGPVVQLRETGGAVEVLDDPEPSVAYRGPLAVLVDRYSASASEIFAAAIQDYGRGLVIGQQTYGKGTVQNLIPLDRFALGPQPAFGQLTVTIGKFYRVTGESTQNRGVTPDIALPFPISPEEIGESTRTHALPWDRIAGVPYKGSARLNDAVNSLARNHDQRSVVDPDFRSLVDDVAAYDRQRRQKTVSLNLETRQAERGQMEAERLERENTRRAAAGLAPVKSLDEVKEEDLVDVILSETTQIVADMAELPMLAGVPAEKDNARPRPN